ncbi:IS1182 family transposase [Streptomyces turgidiscabies]|uniref:Transposase n=1 Tax=Streptomyces turgidiscabies TaxID=85558 RepID=A0ABU0RI88_9ACTN|nr:IS1182 family transposase [Streptomyces turgidiscabies]MDQ0931703.1 transposase [Streptomyces turgidiscabies]MDQ0934397.1 transposase [Streptomyces turgidiscabies]MDQ0934935.1 transposase [Streptomyces turgidiscabies]MDQ0936363.1 transposase [Streptomyces turgidiscabies]MDQ0937300.1 transposase [Streptomyces turgidiscabies]
MPELTRRVARAAFPRGSLAIRLRDSLGQVFDDVLFTEAFPSDGRPAASPGVLAMVSVMQYAERLSDRQAAEAVRARIDWKYLLGLDLDDSGFDHSLLARFRARLIARGLEERVLEAVLEAAAGHGLLRRGGRQRTDSTRVVADVRLLNRMEFVAETLRAALEALAAAAPNWLEQALAERETDWLGRYGERVDSWHGLPDDQDRDSWLRQVGEDGFHLLTAAWRPDAPDWLRRIPAVQTLRRAWVQQYHRDESGVRVREGEDLPPGHQRLASPYDTDARYGIKKTTGWVGYCLHLTETCDDDVPRLITDVATTGAAEGDDSQALPGIHTRLAGRKLLPAEQLVDSGYVTAGTLVAARQEHGIDLVGPARRIAGGDGRERFGHDDFQIDDARRQAVCPTGQTSISWANTHSSRRTRVPLVQIRFDAAACRDCPLRSRCTTAGNGKWGRALTLREPAQRAALQQRRREQDTAAWRARYRPRAGIEATVCQIVHRTHARRSRYRTAPATHLGHCLAATALNLIRLDAWQQGHRPEHTRTTHLCRLLTHPSK